MHLIGFNTTLNANDFYSKCLSGMLEENDFDYLSSFVYFLLWPSFWNIDAQLAWNNLDHSRILLFPCLPISSSLAILAADVLPLKYSSQALTFCSTVY